MSLRLLWIFKMVYECESISLAAKKLYMSQPAVTHAIKELEEKTSLILFERIGKRLYISENGRHYYQKVCKLLMVVDEFEQSTKEIQEKPVLRVGSSITNASLLLPKLLAKFQEMGHPPVQVVVNNAATIEEKLLHNEIDIAFIEGAIHCDQLIQHPLFSYDITLFCGNAHPRKDMETVSLKDLKKEAWVLREKGSAIRDCFDSAMLLQDIVISPIWESVNSQVLIQAVKENLGISVLPKALLEYELQQGTIQSIELETPLSCINHVVYHKDKHVLPAMRELIDICLTFHPTKV